MELLVNTEVNPSESSLLKSLQQVAPIFQQLSYQDIMITIADLNKYVYCLPATSIKVDLSKIVGSEMPPTAPLYEAIHSNKKIIKPVPKEMFGAPFRSISIPLQNEHGEVIGGIALATNMTVQATLEETAHTLASATEEIAATAEMLGSTAGTLADDLIELKNSGEMVLSSLVKTDDIIHFINDVSANSNLLGLNAAIEAARAREHGRGFAVVAEEIRKMAANSANSIKEIRTILATINQESVKVVERVTQASLLSKQQAVATREISAAIQQLNDSAGNISQLAQTL